MNDVVFDSDIWFVIGEDDTSGPIVEIDPVDGSVRCSMDGSRPATRHRPPRGRPAA